MNQLQELFLGVGFKRVSNVEIDPLRSNQHELNGVSPFKKLFGTGKRSFKGRFIYLPDEKEQFFEEDGVCTWYDARANHPTRTEYRLFYSNSSIFQRANEDDLLVILWKSEDELWLILTPKDSTTEQQLIWLFDLEKIESRDLPKIKLDFNDKEETFAKNYILESLGIETPVLGDDFLDKLLTTFNGTFPTTREFSSFARNTLSFLPVQDSPDEALLMCYEREELLFRTLERYLVEKKLQEGFGENGTDVDQFISYSLHVQNRRKSRAGYSLENHLSYIFDKNNLNYSRGKITERKNKPDFIFPNIDSYRSLEFPSHLLKMLGSKTSAKDRWRQILSEAKRINNKHLITLEPSISIAQTDEMKSSDVTLVVPSPIQLTYTKEQQSDLMSLAEFLAIIKENESEAGKYWIK